MQAKEETDININSKTLENRLNTTEETDTKNNNNTFDTLNLISDNNINVIIIYYVEREIAN